MPDRSEAPTFWMNVTTSANWKRSPVGIVRTEQEVRRHLRNMLKDRLQPVIFKDHRFVSETLVGMAANPDDFWPEPSYGSSADPFDPGQMGAVMASSLSGGRSRTPRFRYGDILITMGLDWEYPGLHDEIRRLAKAYNLTVITCCYDLIPVKYPQYCVGDVAAWFKNYFIEMTWSADGVLCISENTRRDYEEIARNLGMPARRTEIIKLGSTLPPQDERSPISDEVSRVLEERFFLFVSTIERRKNHEVLYRAYHLLRLENPDVELPKLVFVGMEGWGVSELMSDLRLDPLTKDDIVVLSHVSDNELLLLYRQCEAFLFPSHYEGWGMPIAEALQLGRPVLASSAGSIPEVGGDLVRYLDPWSPREWADELLKIANGQTDLSDWSKRILSNFVPCDWSSAAETILEMANDLRRRKPSKRVLHPGYDLSTVNGVHYGDKIIYEGREGIVFHGPYIDLARGSYKAVVLINWISGEDGSLYFAARHEEGKSRIAVERLDIRRLEPGPHSVTLTLNLSEDIHRLEFFCEARCCGKIRLSVDEIAITRIESEPSRHKSEQRSQIRAA